MTIVMSEADFDLYLTLLNRFMRLTPRQGEAIGDELRDHLESRLEDLARGGMSREAAIRQALEEFGDATHLAQHFTSLARARHRRMIMRCSIGTGLAALLLVGFFMAFAPSTPAPHGATMSSVQAKEDASPKVQGQVKSAKDNRTVEAIECELDQWRMKAEILDSTLGDSLNFIADSIKVDIVLKGGDPNQLVKLMVHRREVSARTVLELLLDQVGGLSYQVRDGYIYVTDTPQSLETRVYDCRELLIDANQDSSAEMLINVISTTVLPESWNLNGGHATCAAFNGSLVIKQSPQAHREIEQLLDMLRKASKK